MIEDDSTPCDIKVIAEVGCNHKGDMAIARRMIRVAAEFCNADVIKFQKRNNRELLSREEYDRPHPVPENAYGNTYGAHREFLEFTTEQHAELKEECERMGVAYSTSVWDLTSAKEMAALQPALLKIPSATNLNFELQDYLCAHFKGEIHVSTGMTTLAEMDQIVERYEQNGRAQDLVLYACTSGYPVSVEDICLLEINRIQERYRKRIKAVGFSGHHLGISPDVSALTVGMLGERDLQAAPFRYIERHFTLNRAWKGTDHAASLEPDGLRRLCRDIRSVEKALTLKTEEILPVEQVQRDKLKWFPERH